MSGCEGCFQSAKGQQEAYKIIKSKAEKYSKENGKSVAIYKEGFEWLFTTVDNAIASGYPIYEVISAYK